MKKLFILFVIFLAISPLIGFAEDNTIEDGTYDATVTTDSGIYPVPVEVDGGEVTYVHWPDGGDMTVSGADIDDNGEASGLNSRGDSINIEIEQ